MVTYYSAFGRPQCSWMCFMKVERRCESRPAGPFEDDANLAFCCRSVLAYNGPRSVLFFPYPLIFSSCASTFSAYRSTFSLHTLVGSTSFFHISILFFSQQKAGLRIRSFQNLRCVQTMSNSCQLSNLSSRTASFNFIHHCTRLIDFVVY